jgi:serine/threonine protein kinase
MKGTIPFMAPEVVCQNKYGCKADIWSLGCLLIEMKTGKNPWGNLDNFAAALFKIGKSNQLPKFPEDISNEFKHFLSNCINRNPKERANINFLINHPFVN